MTDLFTDYRVTAASGAMISIERSRDDLDGRTDPPTRQGIEREVIHLRLAPDGVLCADSASKALPGWHQIAKLPAGSGASDVLAAIKGCNFTGRQFWVAA